MTRLTLLTLAAAALVAIGCGDDDSGGDGATQGAEPASTKSDDAMKQEGDAMKPDEGKTGAASSAGQATLAASRRGKGITVVDSEFGDVVADAKGEALYLFGKEKGRKSRCYGECARLWPPAITRGMPRASKGAEQALLGTTRRENGKLQVTYAGHPLYYYVDDSPGTILCHDVVEFGGLWLVVEPDGSRAS